MGEVSQKKMAFFKESNDRFSFFRRDNLGQNILELAWNNRIADLTLPLYTMLRCSYAPVCTKQPNIDNRVRGG